MSLRLAKAHLCPKSQQELTQSRHYLPIRNEPKGHRIHIDSKKHSNWMAERWEVVTQYLFSCVTYGIYNYILPVHSYMHWPRPQIICSGLGSAPNANAHAHNLLHSEAKSKVRPKKISSAWSLYDVLP